MLDNSGYYYRREEDWLLPPAGDGFAVCSCGHYVIESLEQFRTVRPAGRADWQILYMVKGAGHFVSGGQEYLLRPGQVFVYQPWEPQDYCYYMEESPEVYWLHFCGEKAGPLMDRLGFLQERVFCGGEMERCVSLFDAIIRELQVKPPAFVQMCAGLVVELLVSLSRMPGTEQWPDGPIQTAIQEMHRNYQQDIPISEYAKKHNMGFCWFIRSFKAYTGMPPQQFLINVRINKACTLLRDTRLNISEVAAMVGYDNPLYFSRIFKKVTGQPPTGFRMALPAGPPGQENEEPGSGI